MPQSSPTSKSPKKLDHGFSRERPGTWRHGLGAAATAATAAPGPEPVPAMRRRKAASAVESEPGAENMSVCLVRLKNTDP